MKKINNTEKYMVIYERQMRNRIFQNTFCPKFLLLTLMNCFTLNKKIILLSLIFCLRI